MSSNQGCELNGLNNKCLVCINKYDHLQTDGICSDKSCTDIGFLYSQINPISLNECIIKPKQCTDIDENGCKGCVDPSKYTLKFDCVSECPSNHTPIEEPRKRCVKCDKACDGCTGQGNGACKKCSFHYKIDPRSKKCLLHCEEGYFKENKETCLKCKDYIDKNSRTCDKNGPLTCQPRYFLSGNKCQKCHISCGTCKGPDKRNCLDCNQLGYQLKDGRCKSTCKKNQFNDGQTGECTNCLKKFYFAKQCTNDKVISCQ